MYGKCRRRSSHGSAYELVDSEAQWKQVQERNEQHQQKKSLPIASSTPIQAVQQATVRKASSTTVSSTVNAESLSDPNNSVETSSQSSSRHRHHRKHHHHRHDKHSKTRSFSKGFIISF